MPVTQSKPDTSRYPKRDPAPAEIQGPLPSTAQEAARAEAAKQSDLREIESLRSRVASLEASNGELEQTLGIANQLRMKLATFTENLNMLHRLTQELNTLNVEQISEVAVRKIPLMVDAKYVSLFLWDAEAGELVLKNHNHPQEINRQVSIPGREDTVMGIVLRSKRPHLIKDLDDFERDAGVTLARTFGDKYMTRSCVCLPLLSGANLVGVLNLADKNDGGSFDDMNDLPSLEQLAQFLGVALQNCFMYRDIERRARTDGLTNLANHRAFYEGLTREVHRCRRYGNKLSLIMCDVDDFKSVNDTFGHQVGDRVIQVIGKMVASYVRNEDLAARYGGDEFAIILPETPGPGAAIVAERLRERVLTHDFRRDGIELPVRMSYGVAEIQTGMSPADLVKAADLALYEAKAGGKDRIRYAPSG